MVPLTRSSMGLKETSTPFGSPFDDDDDADTILRSSDRVDFYVYRVILSKSSPFFKSMFSLPQPDASVSEKRPVVEFTENSGTIALILKLTSNYLVVTKPPSLVVMMNAFAAAKKYEMATTSQRLSKMFAESKIVQKSPIKAFCVAYSNELGEAARIAAKASLKHRMSLDDIGDELQYTNGPAFYQLYKFHRACSATAAKAVSDKNLPWITQSDITWWDFASDYYSECKCPKEYYRLGPGPSRTSWHSTIPWKKYIERAHKVLLRNPCREAVAHYSIVRPTYDEDMCLTCQKSLFGLPEFVRLLGEEVERRVSKVNLELPF